MLSQAGLNGLDFLLQPRNHPQLLFLFIPKLLPYLLRHLTIFEFISDIFLNDIINDLFEFKHLTNQFFILLY
jgi:hypothetical protein